MKRSYIILFLVLGILFIPWLGECVFNTKGEPREAIVAVSMLDSGNWILPESFGQDIPYKPPMLAWLISIFSLVFNGGHVNEFTSRLAGENMPSPSPPGGPRRRYPPFFCLLPATGCYARASTNPRHGLSP